MSKTHKLDPDSDAARTVTGLARHYSDLRGAMLHLKILLHSKREGWESDAKEIIERTLTATEKLP